MIKVLNFFLLLTILSGNLAFGDENLITDAGREVVVNDDGSWNFASDDRYATNALGERVKLKADGTWEILSVDENITTQHDAVFRNSSNYQPIEFEITRAVIENHRTRTSVSSKNTHVRTQTIFYLTVSVPTTELESHSLSSLIQAISVADSADKHYDVISVSPSSLTVSPGGSQALAVIINDAPTWKLGKSYDLTISSSILSNGDNIVLRIPLSEVKQFDVDELSVLSL